MDFTDYYQRDEEYKKLIGEFILDCNFFEQQCNGIILNYFMDTNDKGKSKEFVKSYFSKNNSFRGSVLQALGLITKHKAEFQEENKEVISVKSFQKIVKLRNILAHSTYVIGSDLNYFTLSWISSSSDLEEYKKGNEPDDLYGFKVLRSEFKIYLKKLEEINRLLFDLRFDEKSLKENARVE